MISVAVGDARLRLDLFEGPLDLLLYLIRRSEIDVHDIPIVEVTAQYQDMIERARDAGLLDLDVAGDYFLMAATLIQIKTRMLLPRPADEDGLAEADPRRELVQQLLEYERFKEAASLLRERMDLVATMVARPPEALEEVHGTIEPNLEVDLIVLAKAFQGVMQEKRLRTPHVLPPLRYTVGDRIRHVLRALDRRGETAGRTPFRSLFQEGTLEELIATFLALLELAKRGFVRCVQRDPDADIEVELTPADDRPDAAQADAASEFDAVLGPEVSGLPESGPEGAEEQGQGGGDPRVR